jgi:hypothetical protein
LGVVPCAFHKPQQTHGRPGSPFSGLPKGMLGSILQMCREVGIDPEELFKEAAAGKPFRFRPDERSSRSKN